MLKKKKRWFRYIADNIEISSGTSYKENSDEENSVEWD